MDQLSLSDHNPAADFGINPQLTENNILDSYRPVFDSASYAEQLAEANKDNDPVHLVLYTDGGWRNHPPMGGWGLHGYFCTEKEPKQGTGCKDAILTTRGYQKKDSAEKQVTVLFYVDGCGGLPNSTNNHAELEGLAVALIIGLVNKVASLTLKLDSEYALKGASERMERMREFDFKNPNTGEAIPNAETWMAISRLMALYQEREIPIVWQWVKGHSDSVGNNKADQHATRGITMGRNDVFGAHLFFRQRQGYWNPSAEFNRLLNVSRWYFQTGRRAPDDAEYFTYYLGAHGTEDKDHGVPSGTSHHAVVRLKERDPVLTILEDHVNNQCPDQINRIMIGRLDYIFNPNHYNDLLNGGANFLMRKGPRLDFYIADKMPVLAELDPPRKGLEAAVALNKLELVLDRALANDEPEHYVVNDITDVIYETDTSKKKPVTKIKSHIDSSLASLTVPLKSPVNADPVDVTLTLGLDTPSRNLMAHIAGENPQVWVVTWKESDTAFRYATVVKTEHNVGIWAGTYSNLRILPSSSRG